MKPTSMKPSLLGGLFTALIIALAFPAASEPVKLKLGTWGPAKSFFYVEVIDPWIAKVNRDSEGTLEIKHFPGGVLGNPRTIYDSIKNNVAHIGWALPHAVRGKFVKSSIIGLPFGYESGEKGAVAFWRLFEKGLIASDYDEIKLLGLTAWPAAAIQSSKKKITKLEDLKGMKFRISGGLQASTVKQLGGTPVAIRVTQIYQSLDKGVIDAAWASLTATRPFRIYEVAKYFLNIPLNGAGGMLAMNKDTFEKLPAKAKAAIAKHSGETLSRQLGRSNDGEVRRVVALLDKRSKSGKAEFYKLSAAEDARWRAAISPVIDAWVKRTPDGARILKEFRAEIAALKAGAK